jgi:hypothetical protein
MASAQAAEPGRAEVQRVDVGFQGGGVLAVRVTSDAYKELREALGDAKADRWFELKTQDSEVALDLSQVVYVRIDTEAHRVGF